MNTQCCNFCYLCRNLIRSKKISMEDGMEARKLVNFPGGLELHIGVRRADTALL